MEAAGQAPASGLLREKRMKLHFLAVIAALLLSAAVSASSEPAQSATRVSIIAAARLSESLTGTPKMTAPLVAAFDAEGRLIGFESGWRPESRKSVATLISGGDSGRGIGLAEALGHAGVAYTDGADLTLVTLSINQACDPCALMEQAVTEVVEHSAGLRWIRLQVQPTPRP